MKKKILSLVLALTMLATASPSTVFAADVNQEAVDAENFFDDTDVEKVEESEFQENVEENQSEEISEVEFQDEEVDEQQENQQINNDYFELFSDGEDEAENVGDGFKDVIASGEVNENSTWILYEDGELVINGIGDIPNYEEIYDDDDWQNDSTGKTTAPWSEYCEKIKKISISKGITQIGTCAFEYCRNLIRVNIPEGVTGIGDCAFKECSELENVTIPKGVQFVGSEAFRSCSINNIVFPENLEWIGDYAFEHSPITTLILPYGIKSIGNHAFNASKTIERVSIPYTLESIKIHSFGGLDMYDLEPWESKITILYAGAEAEWENIEGSGAYYDYDESFDDIDWNHNYEECSSNECEYEMGAIYCTINYFQELNHTHHRFYDWSTWSEATVFKPKEEAKTCYVSSCNVRQSRYVGEKLKPTIKTSVSKLVMKKQNKITRFKVYGLARGDSLDSWKSSNSQIVKISGHSNGTCVITAGNKIGKAYITIKLKSGLTKRIPVTVQKADVKTTKITGVIKSKAMYKGQKITLKPVLEPLNSSQNITYKSNNKKVATVNSKGVIKACGVGNTSIIVQSGSKKVVCKIKVVYQNPNFGAVLKKYNTRDNYFVVKYHNWGNKPLYIRPENAKVEEVDYKSYDRYLRMNGGKTIRINPNKTVYIKFWVRGSLTWYDYTSFTLLYKFTYDGGTYDGHVWHDDSVYKKGKKWYKTYWTTYEDKYWTWLTYA